MRTVGTRSRAAVNALHGQAVYLFIACSDFVREMLPPQDDMHAKLGQLESRLRVYKLDEVLNRNASGECWLILDGALCRAATSRAASTASA